MTYSLGKTKPDELLNIHVSKTFIAARNLLTPARLIAFNRFGISDDLAFDMVKKSTLLHDLGKATEEWQEAAKNGSKRLPIHSIISFFGAVWALDIRISNHISKSDTAILMAILGHHGQMNRRSFQPENHDHESILAIDKDWSELAEKATGFTKVLPKKNTNLKHVCDIVTHFKEGSYSDSSSLFDLLQIKSLYDLLLTILVAADQSASGGKEPLLSDFHHPVLKDGEFTFFQNQVGSSLEEMLCAIAGCGSGKTVAALEHACTLSEKHLIDRIVFCLPTKFTSNSLVKDMINDYGYLQEEVGIIHGEALQFLEELSKQDGYESIDEDDLKQLVYQNARYEKMITISTVDHLLMSCYHGFRHADRAFGNLLTSLVVFDEIHSYEPTTLNAIHECTRILSLSQIPYMFMSATMPASMRHFLGVNDDKVIIEEKNPFHPFIPEWNSQPLTKGKGIHTEVTEECREILRESGGLKLAFYVNQVERAKAIAREAKQIFEDVPVYCYHSELTSTDRLKIENMVKEIFKRGRHDPAIVIATQAAELSLNICADRMVSELAPADTIIQRAGRLNRRGLTAHDENGRPFRLIITGLKCEDSDDDGVYLPYNNPDLLIRTIKEAPLQKEFSFQKGINWCEEVLTDPIPEFTIGLIDACRDDVIFGSSPQENYGDGEEDPKVKIRDKMDTTFLVIPEKYVTLAEGHALNEVIRYQVPLRSRKYYMLKNDGFIEQRCIIVKQVKKGSQNKKEYEDLSYRISVVKSNIPYEPDQGGFDFTVLFDLDSNNEILAHVSDSQFD